MTERDEETPPEPSPGPEGYHPDVTVSREDIELGESGEADFAAADTNPVADESVDGLLAALEAADATERQRATLALSEREPGEDALDALAERAADDPEALVRQFAVEALGDLAETTPDAVVAALSDADPWVRAEAVVALDHLDREAHAERIEAGLDDDHHAVRRNAVISLWKSRSEDALPALLALADDESDRVREWVAELLGRIDHPDAEDALKELRADEESVVAKTAANALDGPDATPGPPGGTAPDGTNPASSKDQPPQL
ncbi:HEAT repeats containing protein [Halorhabdus sp. SVX81]|uniref:HEAT repeat domain-containing protein n=1 Tax=Halorhabdus sp. SVX81 TaxID=2978283 RepID=UPI0023DBEECB|nr:HEAT repeat domain-containing protein [Halorhabdus sp. SVX81]WEL17543.1 HEAT repeats containing protein [Halorhabdus sp. SVX81]